MWQEFCGNTKSVCNCIKVLNRHHDACSNFMPRSNCNTKCTTFDSIQDCSPKQTHCHHKCQQRRSCCMHWSCPKIKIKNMYSDSSINQCGCCSISSRPQFNDQCYDDYNSCNNNCKNEENCNQNYEASKKDDEACNENIETSKMERDRVTNNEVVCSTKETLKTSTDCTKVKSSTCNTSKTADANDKTCMQPNMLTTTTNQTTEFANESCVPIKSKSKISMLCIGENSKTTASLKLLHEDCDLSDTGTYSIDTSDNDCSCNFSCPQCCKNITYCPYDMKENCCFQCPQCCRIIKYFDGSCEQPCSEDTNCTCTNCATKPWCRVRNSFGNDEESRKKQIYSEFIEFCRVNGYHPQIMECLLLLSRNMCRQNIHELQCHYNSYGTCQRVPFSDQVPPMTNYCMYGSRLDDWFTHYLMRYLSRANSEEEHRALAWFHDVNNVIEEKHIMEYYQNQRLKCFKQKGTVNNLSRLYNYTVEPTLSELCFNQTCSP